MLISLMPTAFAASKYDDYMDEYVDLDDVLYWEDTDFEKVDIWDDTYYIEISSLDRYAPAIRYTSNNKDAEDDLLDYDEDIYFDADSNDVDEGEYEYEIYCYNRYKDDVGVVLMTLTVGDGGSSSSSADGDIYAEIDKNGYVDLYDYEEDLYDYGWDNLDGTPDSIKFTSWSNGDLYYDDDGEVSTRTYFDLENKNQDSDLEYYGIFFEIDDDSEEAYIYFTIYDDGNDSCTGTIVINGDGSSSGDITYSTEYNTEVYFEGSDFEDLLSSSQELAYVTFTLPSSSKGVLYWDDSKLASNDKLDSDDLDEVSFVPKTGVTGDVSIAFKLYYYKSSSSKTTSSMSGTVVISIDDGSTITYTGEVDEEVEFDADDFDDVCYDLTGKYLDYVKFTLPSSSKGTLYAVYTGSSKSNVAAKSTTKFYVDADDDDYALDDVVFVPASSGTVEISYTAYYTSGSSTKSFTGKVKVTTTAGTLKDISYSVTGTSGVTFAASDFTAALKAKTSKTLSYVTFTLPRSTEGVLYYNGTTKVSASTQYKATGSTNSLDKVSFVPASTASDSVTINYTARDTSGNSYSGAVVIKTFVGEDTVITYSTTGTAAFFKTSDFTSACTKKLGTTLSYVKFTLPDSSQGTLYYGWGSTEQTRVTANTKYTAATYLPYVSFVPKAGFSGTATIVYTGYDTSENFYIGSIQVTVTPATTSSNFTDANASWVASSADFLQANGVYAGVVSGSTLGVGTDITRGEVMQMIYNAFNLRNKVTSVTSNFTDVPSSHANYTAINAGYALGIAQGYAGAFRPDEPITREDACTLLYRAFTTLGLQMSTGTASDLASFSDRASVSSYAVDAVAGMVKSGIIVGDENGINPKGNLTRGEMSVIIHRAMTL